MKKERKGKMISYITGALTEIEEDMVIIESNGIGYGIYVPSSIMPYLPAPGEKIKLYTYLYVREDAFALYGFKEKEDLKIFRLLLGVSGIGPKGALGILSAITPDELRFAILAEDIKTISKAPGIGLKTAKKMILELKDKMDLKEDFMLDKGDKIENRTERINQHDKRNEAVMALTALGYSGTDALKAVKKVDMTEDMTVEQLLKKALKNFR